MRLALPRTGSIHGALRRRGVALISVVAVLVVLALVATVFVVTMRDSRARGERFLYSARADAEAESLFGLVRAHLAKTLEHVEYRRMHELGDEDPDEIALPLEATPTSDVLAEFQLPPAVTDRFNELRSREHRVWSVQVVDQQGLLDLNSCSYPVLANILGRTELDADVRSDDTTIGVRDGAALPEQDGVVRIAGEVVYYEQRVGDELLGCRRGFRSDLAENSVGREHAEGDTVIHEAAFQIATRPYRVRPPGFARFTNPYQARSISEFGVTALSPRMFDDLRQHVTAWGGSTAGEGWSNPQLVRNDVGAEDSEGHIVTIGNGRYFGPGTMVKITDGVRADYGVVTEILGSGQVNVVGEFRHDFNADAARIYGRARTPVNVNTVPFDTLVHVFTGLRLRGRSRGIDRDQAARLAGFLMDWTHPDQPDAAPGVYRNWEELVDALEEARDVERILGQEEFAAVLRNALNANDARLAFSTVPFVFRSSDLYEVRATASILDATGRELARRELRRLYSASSARSEVAVLESQDDFQRQVIPTRDAKWFATWPDNVNAYHDPGNVPASEYRPFSQLDRFPSRSRLRGVGDVRLLPARYDFDGRPDRYFHFDDSDLHEGADLAEDPVVFDVGGPYSTEDFQADLIQVRDVEGIADDVEAGLRPFTLAFLYRPDWSRGGSDHTIFDYGLEDQHVNRVSLRYDAGRDVLVLAVADATLEARSVEVFYDFDPGGWEDGQWYHIGVAVHGCSPELIDLFIDGERVGRSTGITRLSSAVPGDGDVLSLNVDDASTFPDHGVLCLQSEFGIELIEYAARTERTFFVKRRKARTIDTEDLDLEFRPHAAGTIVRLYGFAAPLWTDIRRGGARLPTSLGPYRMYRMANQSDTVISVYTPPDDGSGEPPEPEIDTYVGLVHLPDYEPTILLTEWDTGSIEEDIQNDLGDVGTEGYALLVCPRGTIQDDDGALEAMKGSESSGGSGGPGGGVTPGTGGGGTGGGVTPGTGGGADTQVVEVGGVDVVRYRVEEFDRDAGLKVTLLARGLDLRHIGSSNWMNPNSGGGGRFFPTYDYGNDPAAPQGHTKIIQPGVASGVAGQVGSQTGTPPPLAGLWTAFIPIAVTGEGAAADYLDPTRAEPQLDDDGDTYAYVQIDSEWCKYDSVDTTTLPGSVIFYRDTTLADRLDDFFLNVETTLDRFSPQQQPSFQNAGGSGGTSTGALEPPRAQDGNAETGLPPEPVAPAGSGGGGGVGTGGGSPGGGGVNTGVGGSGTTTFEPPPHRAIEIVEALDFRGYEIASRNERHRIANTIPREHDASAEVRPTFRVVPGNGIETGEAARGAYPGFNDLLTLRDYDGRDEQVRVQWGYRGWCGLTDDTIQIWGWNRLGYEDRLGLLDSRLFARVLKFPSGEMPDSELTKSVPDFRMAISNTGQGPSDGMVDELTFPAMEFPAERPDWALVGEVPILFTQLVEPAAGAPDLVRFPGIDAEQTEIPIHMDHFRDVQRRVLVFGLDIDEDVYPEDGGVVRIDDELILYGEIDRQRGLLRECRRGAFETGPAVHSYGARVVPVETFAATRLNSSAGTSTAHFELEDASDFPDAGYLRIADGEEIVGYTESSDNALSGPLGRIDPTTTRDDDPREDARSAGALFRGRFATPRESYAPGDVVVAMPFRVWDRHSEYSDDPENSYTQFSWTRPGAIWKRVTWDERPEEFVEVLALLRFSGGPEWDSADVIRVGQEEMPPAGDRRLHLYEISDPGAPNLINVQADRIEVRLVVRYDEGAYDRFAPERPDHWKNTPWIERVRVEFVAPPMVLYQE